MKIYILEGTRLSGEQVYQVIRLARGETLEQLELDAVRVQKRRVPRRLAERPLPCRSVLAVIRSIRQLLENGLSLGDAMRLLIHDSPGCLERYLYTSLKESITAGMALSKALQQLKPLFSDFFISIVKASERSGNFLNGLKDLERFYAEQVERREKIRQILRYPKIVLGFSLIFSFGILVGVIPMFKNIYRLQGENLPVLTRGMVWLSDGLHRYPWLWSGVLGGIVLLGIILKKRPGSGRLLRKISACLTGQTDDQWFIAYALGMLLKNGMDTLDALEVLVECGQKPVAKRAGLLRTYLEKGWSFSEAIRAVKGFSDIFYYSVLSAESAGKLYVGFDQVCGYLRRKRGDWFQLISRLLEPLVMVVLGVLVFLILLGVYLPIFEMGNYVG